jgi:hypothetical protein
VNFFGHAAFAFYERDDSAFVLGAMLPDFASMIRARPPRAEHEQLALGIAHHHATDEVFHGAPAFRRLCHDSFGALERRGVRRGTARAVAHIGVELMLDTVLARDEATCSAYLRALAHARDASVDRHVRWNDDEERQRFTELCSALARRGLDVPASHIDVLVWRLSRALSGRARLELRPEDEPEVRAWAQATEAAIHADAPELFQQVRAGLAEHGGSHNAAGTV